MTRTILFLDFDGVLHGEHGPLFSRVSNLEHYLRLMPKLDIVISSTWRETHTLAQLQANFSQDIRSRIIGMTPVLPWNDEVGTRQREIESYLAMHFLDEESCSWRALDDIAWYFKPACPRLILVDPTTGFRDQDGRALLAWYAHLHG